MSPEDLCYTPASILAPVLRGKELSPVELCQAVLDQIEALEGVLNLLDALTDQAIANGETSEAEALIKDNEGDEKA